MIVRAAPPLLPEGRYWGTVVQVDTAKSPFPPRRRDRDLQRDLWKLYIHLRLEHGDGHDAERHLNRWRAAHEGRSPVIFAPIPFRTLPGKAAPEAPHVKDKLFKLLSMLAGDHRLKHGERFDFQAFVGMVALVEVRTCLRDGDGDMVPQQARYSYGRKIHALKPPPISTTWVEKGVGGGGSRVSGQGSRVLVTGSGVGSPDGSRAPHQPDGDGGDSAPSGSTPTRAQIETVFGRGADVAERGRCPVCDSMRFGRSGEAGQCLNCGNGAGR